MFKDIDGFKNLYLSEFGEYLSDEDSERKARMILGLYSSVYSSVLDVINEPN